MNAVAMMTVLLLGAGNPVAPEMKVLEKMVGTWKSENVLKVAPDGSTPATSTSTAKTSLILGGRFIENKNYGADGALQNTMIFGYDDRAKVYRQWLFSSNGDTLESEGTWNEEAKILTFVKEGGGHKGVFAIHFVDDNTMHSTIVWKDAAGKVTYDLDCKATRQK